MRSTFIDWLQRNVPDDFRAQHYMDVQKEFSQVFATGELDEPFFDPDQPIGNDERIIEFLSSKDIAVNRADKNITSRQAIRDDRIQEYLM